MLEALAAALLFGASAPVAKVLLSDFKPIALAGCLYLGSGLGLSVLGLLASRRGSGSEREAQIQATDLPWLAGSILAGGVAAPILLLFSLKDTPAATASLLLNFEAVATTLIAALAFRESIGRRAWMATGLITLGCILLSLDISAPWGFSLGAFGIIGACVLWGLDNNLTRSISSKDPVSIGTAKGLAAGGFSFVLALLLGTGFPALKFVLGALLLGAVSYGLSIALFVRAMRALGAARTSTLFGTAPFAGMMLSFLIFREGPQLIFLAALAIMIAGAFALLSERHAHYHVHEMVIHEHAHNHLDEHHEHGHGNEEAAEHAHVHQHAATAHEHRHTPDLHHRHSHRGGS